MISRSAQIVSRTPSPDDLDPARSTAFDDDARGDRLRQQFEIAAPPGRLDVSHRGAGAAAVGDVGVEPAKALGHIGIEVVHHREPGLAGGREECLADRQIKPRRLYRYRAAVAMPLAGAAGVGFGFLEVGQHLIEGPPMAPKLRPLVVFERVAAQIQHAVDAARAAEDAPLEPPQPAAIQRRNRLGLEIPIAARRRAGDERGAGILVVSPSFLPPASIRAMRASGIVCDRRPAMTQPAAPAPIDDIIPAPRRR